MSAGIRNIADARVRAGWSRTAEAPAKFLRLSHLRRLRDCEQVAAVCYRKRGSAIEFLLVQTRGGRWTFPKGRTEPGLTHAQAAALEAFEEAGVHGRMEETSFTRYVHRKRSRKSAAGSGQKELTVTAHLCEVTRLDPPQESNRNRTWSSPEQAKQRLREGRTPVYAAELNRVVDRAVNRLRVRSGIAVVADGLQRVQFTVIENPAKAITRPKALGPG
jgi:8-oxo-dGTP pyrophosphatase MutT (NUDIX family)